MATCGNVGGLYVYIHIHTYINNVEVQHVETQQGTNADAVEVHDKGLVLYAGMFLFISFVKELLFYMYVFVLVFSFVCVVCMYVCMHACMHACMHVCMCVYIYIYIYINIWRERDTHVCVCV